MLVTFKTKAHADITLFGDIANSLLKMMGHSGTVPGAILAADVPLALSRLSTAINAENHPPANDDEDAEEAQVGLAQRSLPLISLLKAAIATDSDVMWAE